MKIAKLTDRASQGRAFSLRRVGFTKFACTIFSFGERAAERSLLWAEKQRSPAKAQSFAAITEPKACPRGHASVAKANWTGQTSRAKLRPRPDRHGEHTKRKRAQAARASKKKRKTNTETELAKRARPNKALLPLPRANKGTTRGGQAGSRDGSPPSASEPAPSQNAVGEKREKERLARETRASTKKFYNKQKQGSALENPIWKKKTDKSGNEEKPSCF